MARARLKEGSSKRNSASIANPPSDAAAPIKIGEAARALGVEAYVLRFWETQFPFLRPKHSRSKHRFYDQQDLATLRLIKRLLHSEGYTIAGAKKHIREIGLENVLDGAWSSPAADSKPDTNARKRATDAPLSEHGHGSLQHTLVEIREDLKSLQRLLTD